MRVLFDTNIVLDLLLDRRPWSARAAELFGRVELGSLEGYLGATTITTVHDLATKAIGADGALEQVGRLLALCQIAPVTRSVLEAALTAGPQADFEDAVLEAAARHVGANAIVTRDPRGFEGSSTLLILTPDECAEILAQTER